VVKKPILTIVTPVYNGEKYIAETIESVIKSRIDYPYEYIVLNDGSVDSTASILKNYHDSIRIFSHENMGESATVNRGLENAIGEFITIINADDPLLTPNLINLGCKMLLENPTIAALYPDWKIIDDAGKTLKLNILPDYSDEIMIGKSRCLPGPGTLFRRDIALKIGGRRKEWKFVGDYDFWLRFSRAGNIVRLPGVLAQWRESANSTSISRRGIDMANERIEVMTNFLNENKTSPSLKRSALGNAHYLAARLAFFDEKINGKELIMKAFKLRGGWPEEAKIYVVLYLMLLPFSKKLLANFPSLITRIIRR
jgi:glycosyltransferase involved in cell wall biosynthesis